MGEEKKAGPATEKAPDVIDEHQAEQAARRAAKDALAAGETTLTESTVVTLPVVPPLPSAEPVVTGESSAASVAAAFEPMRVVSVRPGDVGSAVQEWTDSNGEVIVKREVATPSTEDEPLAKRDGLSVVIDAMARTSVGQMLTIDALAELGRVTVAALEPGSGLGALARLGLAAFDPEGPAT